MQAPFPPFSKMRLKGGHVTTAPRSLRGLRALLMVVATLKWALVIVHGKSSKENKGNNEAFQGLCFEMGAASESGCILDR